MITFASELVENHKFPKKQFNNLMKLITRTLGYKYKYNYNYNYN